MRLLYSVLFLLAPLWGNKMIGSIEMPPVENLWGVDVSHHQQRIDWETVAQHNDLQFAFVKATEGGDHQDSLFCTNWEMLQKTGIRRGAYHYFRSYGCGHDQALHFLQTVELSPGDLEVDPAEGVDGVSVHPEDLREVAGLDDGAHAQLSSSFSTFLRVGSSRQTLSPATSPARTSTRSSVAIPAFTGTGLK